jgi:hypothetical protein
LIAFDDDINCNTNKYLGQDIEEFVEY